MKKINLTLFALTLFFILPSARPIYKYVGLFEPIPMLIYALGIIFFIVLLKNKKLVPLLKRWIGNYWYMTFILLCVSVIILYVYPIADGLKIQMRGSDQDDCVIIGASQLLSLNHPYVQKSYFCNPCSPGLGMLLLYAPFVLVKLYPLGAIVFATIAARALQNYFSSLFDASVFLTLLFSSIFIMENLVVGSDLLLLGCGIVILSFSLIKAISTKNLALILGLAVFAGLLSSTRINFLVIAPIVSVYIFLYWRKGALAFAILSLCVALLPSLFVYIQDPALFSPLHLLGKSDKLLQGGLKEIGLIASVLAFIVSIILVKKSINNLPVGLLLSLAPSLISVSIGDLVGRGGSFAAWEGANYLIPIMPLSVALIVGHLSNHDQINPSHCE